MSALDELARVGKAYGKAIRQHKSVEFVNHQAVDEAARWLKEGTHKLTLLGIKNTKDIPREFLERLRAVPGVVWMTVDRMADHGRAIDPYLENPLTGNPMTGSSSGSAYNILNGIIDGAIATDGGGSILGPALSAGLVGINAKGMGLFGSEDKRSTDGFSFRAGIGSIARDFDTSLFLVESLIGHPLVSEETSDIPIHAAVSTNAIDRIPDEIRSQFKTVKTFAIEDGVSREKGISLMKGYFDEGINLILSYEGPVDQNGLGDSIIGGEGQRRSGKYLLKCGNIVNATSIAIPSGESGCGFVIQSPKGMDEGRTAITIARKLAQFTKPSPIHQDYFRKMMNSNPKGFLE